jgi:hypothetical protein
MTRFLVFAMLAVLCWQPFPAVALPDIFGFDGSITVSSMQASPGDVLTVSWKVYNNSTVGIPELPPLPEMFTTAYGPWDEAVFLGTTLLGTETFVGALQPGGGYRFTRDFIVPPDVLPGNRALRIMADYSDVLAEVSETNNWSFYDHAITVLPEPAMFVLIPVGLVMIWRRRKS